MVLHLLFVIETVSANSANYIFSLATLDLLVPPQASPVMVDLVAFLAFENIFLITLILDGA